MHFIVHSFIKNFGIENFKCPTFCRLIGKCLIGCVIFKTNGFRFWPLLISGNFMKYLKICEEISTQIVLIYIWLKFPYFNQVPKNRFMVHQSKVSYSNVTHMWDWLSIENTKIWCNFRPDKRGKLSKIEIIKKTVICRSKWSFWQMKITLMRWR